MVAIEMIIFGLILFGIAGLDFVLGVYFYDWWIKRIEEKEW